MRNGENAAKKAGLLNGVWVVASATKLVPSDEFIPVRFVAGKMPKVSGLELSRTDASEKKKRAEMFVLSVGLKSKRGWKLVFEALSSPSMPLV